MNDHSLSHLHKGDETVIRAVNDWLQDFIIKLNICPFAKREQVKRRIRYSVCEKEGERFILQVLLDELNVLIQYDAIETTLLILSEGLSNFSDYNQFLDKVDALLYETNLEGVFQIASFHPDYQFADTEYSDVENFTNRSPFPILHILRESSLAVAIDEYPDTRKIPENNIKLMQSLGLEAIKGLVK